MSIHEKGLINYTAQVSVLTDGQSILTSGQQYLSQINYIKLRSNLFF